MASPYRPNDTAIWVTNRVQTPGQDSDFSPQLNQFVLPEEKKRRDLQSAKLWGQAEDVKKELVSLIHQVRAKQDRKYGVSSGKEMQPCKWDDVMNEVRSATSRWQDARDKTSKTMAHIERVGKYEDAFSGWLNILPGGDYGSPICGAFQLVIGAAGQYTKVEETIYSALARIPEIISGASHFIRIYKDQPEHSLEAMCFDLFMAVMRVMIQIMRFFLDSSIRKALQSFAQQGDYKRELFASVAEVNDHAERIRHEAQICAQERGMADSQSLLKLRTEFQQYRESTERYRESTERYRESTEILLKQFIYKFVSSEKNPSQISMASIDSGISLDNALLTSLAVQDTPNMEQTKAQQEEEEQVKFDRGRSLGQALMEKLRYDPYAIARDVSFNLLQWDQLDPQSQAKSALVSRNPVFRRFLESPSSSALLINGQADMASAAGSSSPLSNSCAQLVRALESASKSNTNKNSSPSSSPSIFVLRWFCDRYRPYGGGAGGEVIALPRVREMMGSLVSQLLDQMLAKGSRIDPFVDLLDGDWEGGNKNKRKSSQGEGEDGIGDVKLTTLCIIFRNLVGSLAAAATEQQPLSSSTSGSGGVVVFCVLDEIARYEVGPLGADMDAAIRRLTRLVGKHHDDNALAFKLLVTCQGRALGLSRHFLEEEKGYTSTSSSTLNLPEVVEPSDLDRYMASRIL